MRAKCAMYGCKNASYNKLGYMLNYHRFPKDPDRELIWKDLCKNPRIMKIKYTSLYVCSDHFDRSCFMNQQSLRSTAVPNKNLPKKALGLFSMSQEDQKESNSATEFDDRVKIEVTVDSEDEVFCKEVKAENTSEGDDTDSSKLLDGSGDESISSQPPRYVTVTQSSVAPETLSPRITSVNSLAQPSTSATDEKIDDSSTFAEFVKTRMRSFDPVQRTIAQKLISDVMFLAGTRQLQFGTAVLNPMVIGPQITIDGTGPDATDSSPQVVAQARLSVNNGAKKTGSFSAYVVDDDSDDDAPLAKRSNNNI